MKLGKTFQSLRTQVGELRRTQFLADDFTAFGYWFCQSLLANPDDHSQIKQALVGGRDDRNVDILFVSDAARTVFICQTKYRQSLMKKNEPPNEVRAHADIARAYAGSEKELEKCVTHIKADARHRLRETWKLVRLRDYSLRLIYATTGKVSSAIREEAEQIVDSVRLPNGRKPDFEYLVYDGKDCCRLFVEYQDLVPSIPFIEFEDIRDRIRVDDERERLHSYVFSLPVATIRRLYTLHHERLFARNIRLWRGESMTNIQIERTLAEQPHEFFYLNNGITFLASEAHFHHSDTKLRVLSPQIINGQQTTRTMARCQRNLSGSSRVLVKVIWKDAETDSAVTELRNFIRRVVRATNFQNKVSLSELAANDPEHIALDRAFRSRNWKYLRKKGKEDTESGDMPAWLGQDKKIHQVTLQELATALMACLYDPQFIRTEGIESIFDERRHTIYRRLFNDSRTVDECIMAVLCYWLATDNYERADSWYRTAENFGVYYIAHRIHEQLYPLFRSHPESLLSMLGSDKKKIFYPKAIENLRAAVGLAWRHFVERKISEEQEVSAFIAEYASKSRWDRFWRSGNNKSRVRALAALREISKAVRLAKV